MLEVPVSQLYNIVDSKLKDIVASTGVPGLCVSIFQGGASIEVAVGARVVRRAEALTPETRFPISCVVKGLVALTCFDLERKGQLDLDARIGSYLPELDVGSTGDRGITVRHLLCHTGGFAEPRDPGLRWKFTWEDFVSYFARRHQAFPPGAVWSYTHSGYSILGALITKLVERPALQHMEERFLSSLGIDAEYFSVPKDRSGVTGLHTRVPARSGYEPMVVPKPSGLFDCSVADLALSCRQLMSLARRFSADDDDGRLLRRHAITLPRLVGSERFEGIPLAYCHGIADYSGLYGYNGSYVGSTCALRFDPATGSAFVLAMNAWSPLVRDGLVQSLTRLLQGGRLPTARKPTLDFQLSELEGAYAGLMMGAPPARLTREGEQIVCSLGAEAPAGLIRLGDNGRLKVKSLTPGFAIGVFAEPAGGPALMIGTSAYKKIDSGALMA